MKIYISYFAQMRNFPKQAVPFSTAMWNPSWYQGLTLPQVVMPEEWLRPLYAENQMCQKHCPLHAPCGFMNIYYKFLNTVDFNSVMDLLLTQANAASKGVEPIIILLVYEPATCDCAERPVLQRWFKEHGVDLLEWQPPEKHKYTALF